MSDVKAKASRKTRAKLVAPLSSQPATPPRWLVWNGCFWVDGRPSRTGLRGDGR